MSKAIPQFGKKALGASYIDRPGVYGVIRDDRGHLAVVKAGDGYFLPGGGIVAGESLEAAMERESREECGRSARIIKPIGRADQHCMTRAGRHFTKQCTYVEAEFVVGSECQPTEADHELFWMDPRDAIDRLALEADVWAVKASLKSDTASGSPG